VTEQPHPVLTEELAHKYNYGAFSARYGNIYTARQLRQLFERAFSNFEPVDSIWRLPDGKFIDALRPQITPGGYDDVEEMLTDRRYHLDQVRKLLTECEVFIFTLGLTEAWVSKKDGTVYPICPGVAGGVFSYNDYEFVNFGVGDVYEDLIAFDKAIRGVNPNVKVMLTVSPVPLVATATDGHVLTATTYSKSVLRVAADQFVRAVPDSYYFPSFEIITGSYNRGRYFADDLRSVTEDGVNHVMRLFFKNLTEDGTVPSYMPETVVVDSHTLKMAKVVATSCDEEALDRAP
jgi:hypothetical protein